MNTLLILLAILLFVTQTMSLKLVRADSLPHKLLTNCFFTLLAAVIMGISGIFFPAIFSVGKATLFCGILFGILFALTILFYLSAVSCGPLSYTSFYLSSSMLLPVAAGILFFREKITITLAVSLLFFLGAFYFLNVTEKHTGRNKKWLLFCILTFLCNGSCGIVQKTQQMLSSGTESSGFMLIGFAAASFCYFTAYLCIPGKQKFCGSLQILKRNLLPCCLLAAASLGGNLLLTFLAGSLFGSYLFPLVQGSIIVGVTLCSVVFYKERLTRSGRLGILLGITGIVMIHL